MCTFSYRNLRPTTVVIDANEMPQLPIVLSSPISKLEIGAFDDIASSFDNEHPPFRDRFLDTPPPQPATNQSALISRSYIRPLKSGSSGNLMREF